MCQLFYQCVKNISLWMDGNNLTEGMLNRVEAAIQAYDPCQSCSKHLFGAIPIQLRVVDSQEKEIKKVAQ
jgi:NAD-reducing hydrogenase large subunit